MGKGLDNCSCFFLLNNIILLNRNETLTTLIKDNNYVSKATDLLNIYFKLSFAKWRLAQDYYRACIATLPECKMEKKVRDFYWLGPKASYAASLLLACKFPEDLDCLNQRICMDLFMLQTLTVACLLTQADRHLQQLRCTALFHL